MCFQKTFQIITKTAEGKGLRGIMGRKVWDIEEEKNIGRGKKKRNKIEYIIKINAVPAVVECPR